MWKVLSFQVWTVWIVICASEGNKTTPSAKNASKTKEDVSSAASPSTRNSSALCTFFDTLRGSWHTTLWGNVNITDRHIMFPIDISNKGTKQMDCFIENKANEYILRSKDTFTAFNQELYAFTCVKFEERNKDYIHTTIKTGRQESAGNQSIMGASSSDTINDHAVFCSKVSDNWIEGDMIRKGHEMDGAIGCPPTLLGVLEINYTVPNSPNRCPGRVTMTSCQVPKALTFNHTNCHENATREITEQYTCVLGNLTSVLLYREADNKTQLSPFSCLTYKPDGNSSKTIIASISNYGCGETWKPQRSSGIPETFTLTRLDLCHSTTTTSSSTGPPTNINRHGNGESSKNTTGFNDSTRIHGKTTSGSAESVVHSGLLFLVIIGSTVFLVFDFVKLD